MGNVGYISRVKSTRDAIVYQPVDSFFIEATPTTVARSTPYHDPFIPCTDSWSHDQKGTGVNKLKVPDDQEQQRNVCRFELVFSAFHDRRAGVGIGDI
jgi:hypothetical protein